MPWQQWAADVIGEINPTTGLRKYPLVIISVPRQSGKTRLMGCACTQRALQAPKSYVWSTAQTGQHARRNWLKFTDDLLESSCAINRLFVRKKSRGDEQLLIPRLSSSWNPHPPTEDSLHGEQGDLNLIDEAWVFDEVEGANLMQAITPTHSTRPGAQTVIVSTRGSSSSVWFHNQIERGLAGEPGVALLDWGIADDVDPCDLNEVAAAHPAVGYTQSLESIVSAFHEMGGAKAANEFARAYGNRPTASKTRTIPIEAWEMAASTDDIPTDAPVCLGIAVSHDRDQTALVASAVVHGIPMVEVVDVRPGTRWAAPRIRELWERHHMDIIGDAVGPTAPLINELERDGYEIVKVSSRQLTAACGDLWDMLTTVDSDGMYCPTIKIRPDGDLDLAAEIASRRRIGDAWCWDRRSPAGSIASLEAMTLAIAAAKNYRDPITPLII